MAGHAEEFDDIIDAHASVIFLRDADRQTEAAIKLLGFVGLRPHRVDLTDQADLETVVRANTAGADLPAIFINGQYFSDDAGLRAMASNRALGPALDATGVVYDRRAVMQIRTPNR